MTIKKSLCVKRVLNTSVNLKRITIVRICKVTRKKGTKNNYENADHEMQILNSTIDTLTSNEELYGKYIDKIL